MKVVAFNGSGRRDGNTAILINHVFDEFAKENIETELIQLAGNKIRGCTACYKCVENKNLRCVFDDDPINDCVQKMIHADGIIIGSPVYFTDITAETKALIDRCGYVIGANGGLLKRKVGAAVIAVRRGGAIHAFDSINHFFHIAQVIVPGAIYWNFGIGRNIGEVNDDDEGIRTMKSIAQNMAWLMKKIASG